MPKNKGFFDIRPPKTAGNCRRRVPVKGWDTLVEAFARVVVGNDKVWLVVVGGVDRPEETDTFRRVQARVRACGLSGRVVFTGQRSDIPRLLNAADVFVFPSRSEGLGLALVEAMAAGKACIAARVGGISNLIRDGQNGLLFEREDVNGLSGHMAGALTDEALRVRLGQSAAESSQVFDMEVTTPRIVGLYEELVSGEQERNHTVRGGSVGDP
jgi:glycosyltransferase involved in cell wall biosynthesis